ncbi:hypothetical protein CAEBREN_03000 [Caenorhabditis brenneri]|uniref:BRCT domain-containing protein n=1 Tax=Caenorhabditis brenneri TaxID=135651 RepID=G0M966_CAEBE|nr:hypothetical protein CAEBREN_03000 [Caenorhabditis brenneri]
MRTYSMFILFLILTSFSTTGVQIKGPAQSDLMQVSENFRILSRITNAIHLHFTATETDVPIDQIISEFLRVSMADFIGIASFPPTTVKEKLLEMKKENLKYTLEVQEGIRRCEAIDLKNNDIKMAVNALELFLKLPEQVDLLKDAKSKPADELTKHKDLQENRSMTVCEEIDYENLLQFQSFFDDDPATYKFPNDVQETKKIFEQFMKDTESIQSCLGNLTLLKQELLDIPIMKAYESNRNVTEARKLVGEFSMFSLSSNALNGTIQKLIKNIEMTEPIWKPLEKVKGVSEDDVIGLLYNSITSLEKFLTSYDIIELTHTAGYRISVELLRVFEDLESPWFLKYVAKGTSTKNLTQALAKYQNISEVIVDLEQNWMNMVEEMDGSKGLLTPKLKEAAETLKNITGFGAKLKENKLTLKSLKETTNIIENWFSELNESSTNAALILTYDQERRSAENRVHQIRKIENKVSNVLSSMYPKSKADQEKVSFLLLILKDLLNKHKEKPVNGIPMTKVVMNTLGAREVKLFEMLKEVAEISKELNELVTSKVGTSAITVSIKKIIDEFKILEFAKKFKNEADNLKETINFFNFFNEILEFPNDVMINNLTKYAGHFEKIQDGLSKMRTLVPKRDNRRKSSNFKILPLNNSKALNENLGYSLQVLEDIDFAREDRKELLPKQPFSPQTLELIKREGLRDWIDPSITIMKLLGKADNLNKLAGKVKDKDLVGMTEVFEKAVEIEGLVGRKKQLKDVFESLARENKTPDDTHYFDKAQHHDLDFARHHSQLKNARVTIDSLTTYFDEVFGHIKIKKETIEIPVSYTAIILIGVGFLLLVVIIAMVVYGLTEKGRTFYKNLYLYYFGKPEDFEKRWRYSLFMDTVDGKNSVLDAAREGNKSNLLRALKHGAYIDAYNKFGNTALHMATKFAQPELVRLLITYGADRSLLNYKNLAPIQMIPRDYEKKLPDKAQAYDKIKKIYKKYDRKSFRCSVPRVFPTDSFKIYPDESTDVNLTNDFLDAFRAIVSDEATLQTTHVVYKTDKDGVLVTDSLDALYWLFHGAIIVKEQWMTDCLQNEKLIRKDSDYLIEKVKYRGVVYDTVLAWSEAMAKATMPYLTGIFVTVVADNFRNLMPLSSIVSIQGGVFLNVFPYKQLFNRDSKPYLHANMGPLFLIHDGNQDMDMYKNDPDKMYTVFTEEEFMIFMLKREMQRDTRPNPPSVLIQDE